MHPLITNLSEMKDLELERLLSELNRKYWMSGNPDMRNQIAMVIEAYQVELQDRRHKTWTKQHEEMDVDLASLIRVD